MTHLSKRLLPHDFLTRTFADKSVLRLPDLLSTVKSPDYSLPDDLEADYVVLATIASKSSPISHQNATKQSNEEATSRDEAATAAQNNRGKFMILKLTDLKWTLDLYLFTTAYTRFYKLSPGTVIAILNPGIMAPKPHLRDTGRFSLTLNSSDDTVLEIGTARDLGWCKASRKDGKQCSDWIDKRHTDFCEFHTDIVTERTRRGRMEVQGMSTPFAPGGRKQGRTGYFGGGGKKGSGPKSKSGDFLSAAARRQDGFRKEGMQYNRSTSSKYYIVPSAMTGGGGGSAADLLDADDFMANRGESKAERLRKRLAEREKENELAKRLGDRGNGAGSEYMRLSQHHHSHGPAAASQQTSEGQKGGDEIEPLDASSLGLLGNKAGGVHLSPIKKSLKRGASSAGLDSARKKTRFVTEKGIREAGRESLPGREKCVGLPSGDDEDDLEIE